LALDARGTHRAAAVFIGLVLVQSGVRAAGSLALPLADAAQAVVVVLTVLTDRAGSALAPAVIASLASVGCAVVAVRGYAQKFVAHVRAGALPVRGAFDALADAVADAIAGSETVAGDAELLVIELLFARDADHLGAALGPEIGRIRWIRDDHRHAAVAAQELAAVARRVVDRPRRVDAAATNTHLARGDEARAGWQIAVFGRFARGDQVVDRSSKAAASPNQASKSQPSKSQPSKSQPSPPDQKSHDDGRQRRGRFSRAPHPVLFITCPVGYDRRVDKAAKKLRRVGRYLLADVIASGGMAQVHFGRLLGPGGFSRTCAVKRLHPMLAQDPLFVSTLLDEARLMSRINDSHVVPILDVLHESGEVLIVMEYVAGDSLAGLLKTVTRSSTVVPPLIASAIIADALHGLHAAHEASSEDGEPLALVHRDVSPHNILVGEDGVARVLDFGIAKARGRLANTAEGQVKGKLAYMAPEQLMAESVCRRADVYAAGAVLWELLTGKRLFRGESEGALLGQVMLGTKERPSQHVTLSPELDEIVMGALNTDPKARFATAREMAILLEEKAGVASHRKVGEWLREIAGPTLEKRSAIVRQLERLTEADIEALGEASDLGPFSAGSSSIDRSSPLRSSSTGSGAVPSAPTADGTSLTLSDVNARRSELSGGAQRPNRRLVYGITAAAMLIAGLSAYAVSSSRKSASSSHAGVAPSVAESSTTQGATPTTRVAEEPSSSPSASSSAAHASAAPESSSAARLPRPLVRSKAATTESAQPTVPPSAAVPAAPAGCDPPFTVDARGIRRLKPNCN